MVRARLLCSGEDCAEVFEAYGSLAELEALACDCGCALVLLAWPEPVEVLGGEPAISVVD